MERIQQPTCCPGTTITLARYELKSRSLHLVLSWPRLEASGFAGLKLGTPRASYRSVGKLLCCCNNPLTDYLVRVWLRKLSSHWLPVTPKWGRGVDMRQFPQRGIPGPHTGTLDDGNARGGGCR
jgi:hypothetical protein